MRVPRLLVCSLLIALGVATVAAQTSPDKNLDSSQPLTRQATNEVSTSLIQFQLPFDADSSSHAAPSPNQHGNDSLAIRSIDSPPSHILTLQQNDATCYTLRTYRVARENPQSDSTRPAGYSTCQRATRFQLKTAVDSREIVPR
jgi:hypothetical protein